MKMINHYYLDTIRNNITPINGSQGSQRVGHIDSFSVVPYSNIYSRIKLSETYYISRTSPNKIDEKVSYWEKLNKNKKEREKSHNVNM